MNFDAIRVVLVATTHSGNIGSAARAMKTMGLSSLYLVAPKCEIDEQAYAMASGADDVLRQAVVTTNLPDALQDCHLVFATSVRPRDIDLQGVTPSQCAQKTREGLISKHRIAIIFGREHAGLTNEELLQSHYHVTIPTNPSFSSLNLAQSVQVIAYEIRKELLDPPQILKEPASDLATADQVAGFYQHLEETLVAIGFLDTLSPKRLMQRLRRLFNRTQLEPREVNILRGILKSIQKKTPGDV